MFKAWQCSKFTAGIWLLTSKQHTNTFAATPVGMQQPHCQFAHLQTFHAKVCGIWHYNLQYSQCEWTKQVMQVVEAVLVVEVVEFVSRYKGQCVLSNVESRKHVLHKRYYFFTREQVYVCVCVCVPNSSFFLCLCWLQIINQYLLLTCYRKIERKWSLWFMTQSVCE